MTAPPRWWDGPLLAFDLETTGVDVETARIVTASAVMTAPDGTVLRSRTWLADPGVEIPAEATAIHKVTTEMARAHGRPAPEVADQLAAVLGVEWARGVPVIAMNIGYDLTVLLRELARHRLGRLSVGPCLDPYVIDRAMDVYRKGSRRLDALAAHYRVTLDDAHNSAADALAAVSVVRRQLDKEWYGSALRAMSLAELQTWQASQHAARQASFQDYLRTKADPPQPDAVIDGHWPFRPARSEATA